MKRFLPLFVIFAVSLSLHAGNIVIDGKPYTIDTVANFKVGPGTYYTALQLRGTKRLNVFFLKVDLTNPYISYKSILGRDSIYGTEKPSTGAIRKSKEGTVYFAGTNGDFYDTGTTYNGMPTGGSMVEKEIGTRPINYPVMAVDENKLPYIGLMTFSGSVTTNNGTQAINHINHARETNELVLYNKLNGKFTHTNSFGTEVVVQLLDGESWGVNKTVRAKVTKIELNKGNASIPIGFAVLSGHGTAASFLNTLAVNDEISITQNVLINGISNSYSEVVGGDHRTMMLRNGIPTTDQIWTDLHPRTAFGYSEDKKTSFHCVVDGRGVSAGVSTKELAELMVSAGAYEAINLDGGGSSCLYVKDFGPMNTPSDGTERSVANGIFVVSNAPTNNVITEIRAYETTIKLPHYGVFKPKFLGYNQYGTLINKDVQGVQLNCAENTGFINEKGEFVASGINGGTLSANYSGISTTVKIELVTEAQIAIRLDSVLLDNRREYPIEVQSIIGLNTMLVYPDALTWTIRNPEICTVQRGVLTGLKNGETVVVGNLGSYCDSIKIRVQIPESGRLIIDHFQTPNWTFEASSALNATITNVDLPLGWSIGAVINYTYNATRAPYIKLLRSIPLYSLPDTIKIGVNLGDISLSKAVLSLRANNSTTATTKEFTTITKNTDTHIELPLKSVFNTADISIFPIWFEYLNFYLNVQTSGQSYRLGVKDITLCYEGINLTFISSLRNTKFQVYPNPARNQINIRFEEENKPSTIKMYNLNGKIIQSIDCSNTISNEISIPIQILKSGTYLLNMERNGRLLESVKISKN